MATTDETTVREAIARVAAMQRGVQQQLEDLLVRVPPSPREEVIYEQGLPYDFPTEVRSCLECILEDWMRPTVQDLENLSVVQPSNLSVFRPSRRPAR
ncbi:MAG TPA: hypothetical protein DD490_00735 [Acidobacteria bacterium]|nr:hypothetical protein [Acidobacteriota bacterium]